MVISLSTKEGAGLTEKGRQSINRRTGSNLKAPAPNPKTGTKDAARRKSFCARSRGWTGERGKAARKRLELLMRMAGQVWFPPANQMGQGCAKKPEQYPAKPQGGMSHGDPTKILGMR